MKWSKLTFLSKALITLLAAGAIGAAVYYLAPGLRTAESKKMDKLDISDKDINNINTSAEIALPQSEPSTEVQSKPLVKVAGYAWKRSGFRLRAPTSFTPAKRLNSGAGDGDRTRDQQLGRL